MASEGGGVCIELLGRSASPANAVVADVWPGHRAAGLVQLLALSDGHRLTRDQVLAVYEESMMKVVLLSVAGSPRDRQADGGAVPAASAWTASVVRAWPPMAQSPLLTSSMTHQVTPRMFSPSTLTIASVSRSAIWVFCSGVKTPSMSLTVIRGHVPLLRCLGFESVRAWRTGVPETFPV